MAALDLVSIARSGSQTLPPSRDAWPASAQQAYRHALTELNSWCRDFGWPPGSNSWVAETAVREAWAATSSSFEDGDRLAA